MRGDQKFQGRKVDALLATRGQSFRERREDEERGKGKEEALQPGDASRVI